MQNLPDFMRTWQAFSQLMNKFYSTNEANLNLGPAGFMCYYYSHLTFPAYFTTQTWVNTNVLAFITDPTD